MGIGVLLDRGKGCIGYIKRFRHGVGRCCVGIAHGRKA